MRCRRTRTTITSALRISSLTGEAYRVNAVKSRPAFAKIQSFTRYETPAAAMPTTTTATTRRGATSL